MVYTEKKKKSYAESTYQVAGIGERLVALIIDIILLGIVGNALFPGKAEAFGVELLVGVVYYWIFLVHNRGQTPGSMVMKIRIIRKDGERIDEATVIVRAVVSLISAAVMMIGYLWAFADSNNQTWHDIAAGTYVVKA